MRAREDLERALHVPDSSVKPQTDGIPAKECFGEATELMKNTDQCDASKIKSIAIVQL